VAKRDVVFINYEKIVFLIKKIYRNNTIFCEELNKKMGTTRTTKWVSEWKRNSNLPSPKEAAVICILLKTTPDEILLREGETPEETAKCLEDIETVRKLVEAEGIKEAPATEGKGEKDALIKAVREITDKDTALAVFDELSKKMRELM
jgi:hypothetical protein